MIRQVPAHRNRGFTLLETLMYIALIGILIGGMIVAVYPVFTNSERLSQKVTRDTETAFLLHKLSWALSSVTSLSVSGGDTLTIDMEGGPVVTFEANGTTVDFDGEPLLSSRVKVENLVFDHTIGSDGAPDTVTIEFDIDGLPVGPFQHNVYK